MGRPAARCPPAAGFATLSGRVATKCGFEGRGMKNLLRMFVVGVLLCSTAMAAGIESASAGAPVGFTASLVQGNLQSGLGGLPVAFAYAPDGRIFIARKTGRHRRLRRRRPARLGRHAQRGEQHRGPGHARPRPRSGVRARTTGCS